VRPQNRIATVVGNEKIAVARTDGDTVRLRADIDPL
jgi:hypothetical protein